MQFPEMIELKLEDDRVPIRVQRVSTVLSRHSGRPLTEIHGTASAPDTAAHERMSQALSTLENRSVRSVERFQDRVGRWYVSWNAYAQSGDEHLYKLILREEEELSLEALVIEGLELHPYEYREAFSEEGGLTIWAKLVGSKAGVLRLRALLKTHPFFSVVRRGINEQPRQMRFGVAEWSEHEGQIKYRMVLVDSDADPATHPELIRIEEANQRAAIAFYMNFVERLAGLLEKKGILPREEVEAAREAASEEPWQGRHEFWRVPDVDLL